MPPLPGLLFPEGLTAASNLKDIVVVVHQLQRIKPGGSQRTGLTRTSAHTSYPSGRDMASCLSPVLLGLSASVVMETGPWWRRGWVSCGGVPEALLPTYLTKCLTHTPVMIGVLIEWLMLSILNAIVSQ